MKKPPMCLQLIAIIGQKGGKNEKADNKICPIGSRTHFTNYFSFLVRGDKLVKL